MKNSLRFVFVYQRLLSMSAKTLNPNQTICTDSAEQSRAARSALNRAEESFTSSAISCRSDINRLCYTKGPGMDTLLSRRVLWYRIHRFIVLSFIDQKFRRFSPRACTLLALSKKLIIAVDHCVPHWDWVMFSLVVGNNQVTAYIEGSTANSVKPLKSCRELFESGWLCLHSQDF